MKNSENKLKEIEIGEISLLKENKRKYSSPKRKSNINQKNSNIIEQKKFPKTIKKQKHDLNKNDEKDNNKKYVKQKQILLFQPKDIIKKENPITINTNQNFTPNKPKEINFKLCQTQKREKPRWTPAGKLNFVNDENESNQTNCPTKENRLVYKSNNKKNKSKTNINTLIMNFKKDIPNNQGRIQSLNLKKNNLGENSSYMIGKKRSIFKDRNIEYIPKVKDKDKQKDNNENYSIKIIKKKNNLIKKSDDENILFDKEINKEYFNSYIFNKYSASFAKEQSKINDYFKKSNKLKIMNEKTKKNIQYKTNCHKNSIINENNNNNNVLIKRSFINKNLLNSKVKSSINIKEKNKSMIVKKKPHSSLKENNNKDEISKKKTIKLLDKKNIHQMTEFSETLNNNSNSLKINKIKLKFNTNYKNRTDRKSSSKKKEKKCDTSEDQLIKKIKKNLKVSNNQRKNKSTRNNYNKKERKRNTQYDQIDSHKIMITNININLYKKLNYTNKECMNDNLGVNSEEIRNKNLNLNQCDIELEKIYLLEEKISKILSKINEYQTCEEECQNLITFYFSINFYKMELELFNNNNNKNKISNYMKLEILCYFLCYDISFNENFNQASILIKTIINLLHDNYLLLISYIIYLKNDSFFEKNISNNLWINKLQKIIDDDLKINLTSQDMNENTILSLIVNSIGRINNYYKMIIDNLYSFKNDNEKDKLINSNLNFPNCLKIDTKTISPNDKSKIISLFFIQAYKLLSNYNYENMKFFFYIFLNNSKFHNKKSPIKNEKVNNNNLNQSFLPPIKPNYKYSLILNLDETLIYNNNGKIILRPNLFHFLDIMKEIYELIIFSFESNSFIDKVVETIEQKNKYFDHVLYANQCTLKLNNNGTLVKDLESLGRDLKNIIVIDSKSHLEKKYQNNMILIKGFYGNDLIDTNLLKILGYILQNIKKENYEDDIRLSIEKHKNTIKAYLSNNTNI